MRVTGKVMYVGLSKSEKEEFELWYNSCVCPNFELLLQDDTRLKNAINKWLEITSNNTDI